MAYYTKTFLGIAVAFLSLNVFAQTNQGIHQDDAYSAIRSEPLKSAGVYYVDHFADRDLTPAPKGYKPVYVSMYARHGARYILQDKEYENIHNALTASKKAGTLTAEGEKFYAKYESLYPVVKGRGGDLSPLGARQHKALAKRMYSNYHQVFNRKARILAFSSYLPRTALSMAAFVEGLREENRNLDISTECSKADMGFLNPYSVVYPFFNKWNVSIRDDSSLWGPDFHKMCNERLDTRSFLGKYFEDLDILSKIESLDDLYFDIFDLAGDMQCLDTDVSFMDMFDIDELCALWECEQANYYLLKGPSPVSYHRGESMAVGILEDIVDKADEDIVGGKVNARLRFGHDGCIMGLLSLMKIGGWGEPTLDLNQVKYLWETYKVPMAANLQFIFYRSSKDPDILVKVLLNEKNLKLPLKEEEGPYYRWNDVKAYYKPVMALAEERLGNNDSNGAPVILSGKVVDTEGKPVKGVKVSDGINIVKTDGNGHYKMFSKKEQGFVFITTPTDYVAVSKDGLQPDFYAHLSKPAYEPEIHDFTLRHEDQKSYSMVFITDLHLTNSSEKPDLEEFHNVAMPLIGRQVEKQKKNGPVYSVNLGDLSHDLYWYRFNYNLEDAYNTLKKEDYPTILYSVSGNHDNDGAVSSSNEDRDAEHLYRKVLGPEYYSVDIGGRHWIMMDDIVYVNTPREKTVNRIKGDRDYYKAFTKDQMKWLINDLKYVSDTTKVYICAHAPITCQSPFGGSKSTQFKRLGQMDSLNVLFSRFGKVTIFCGHVHRMEILYTDKYPSFYEYMLPALSGNMWTTLPNRELGTDGVDAGILIGHFLSDTTYYEYQTEKYGEKWLRTYDMNEVGKYYRNDPGIRKQMEMYPKRRDYGLGEYAGYVYVNCWYIHPGERLEVYENGHSLAVERVNQEDPLYNVNYFVPKVAKGEKYTESHANDTNIHMFRVKAKTKNGKILINIVDPKGRILHSETMSRPKAFSPYAE